MTEALGALESPVAEASPLELQTLCLAALSKEVKLHLGLWERQEIFSNKNRK